MSKPRGQEGRPEGVGPPVTGEATQCAAVVRAMYDSLEANDEQALVDCADERIEWVHPMVTRLAFDGVQHGLPAVLRNAFRRAADGGRPRVSADTFLEFGDGVLVVGRFLRSGETEGEQIEEPFLHECFVRGGRVVRIREYPA